MADFNQINQFGSAKPARSGEGMSCAECEALLTDFIDGTLSSGDHAAFDLHIATCKECSQMLADAQRGAALLEMLKSPRPEPPSALLDRIIAQTSGLNSAHAIEFVPSAVTSLLGLSAIDGSDAKGTVPATVTGVMALPAAMPGNVLPFTARAASRFSLQAITRTMMQPRLAMTAAMAFFSIALTMNLTGVHLSELKASDLKPSSIRHSFYQADASIVRYYDNLRVVYELESRVSDLKQANDGDSAPSANKPNSKGDGKTDQSSPDNDQKRKQTPKAGSGTSQRRTPLQPEFKLADERLPQGEAGGNMACAFELTALPLHRSTGTNRSLGTNQSLGTNKSKETFEEGGLV